MNEQMAIFGIPDDKVMMMHLVKVTDWQAKWIMSEPLHVIVNACIADGWRLNIISSVEDEQLGTCPMYEFRREFTVASFTAAYWVWYAKQLGDH